MIKPDRRGRQWNGVLQKLSDRTKYETIFKISIKKLFVATMVHPTLILTVQEILTKDRTDNTGFPLGGIWHNFKS